MADSKLIGKLHRGLPSAGQTLLSKSIALTNRQGVFAYLVGGPVRDLLLDRPPIDLDIVVEGDAIALAHRLAETTGARLRTYQSFGTASLRLDGFVLDLTTARSETYARPGALPTVTPASIHEDLLRRDFTINSMALPLTGTNEAILDPANGQPDLKNGLIRVLHERSFQDDATRIFRAFRYKIRLDSKIEPATRQWLMRDLNFLETISGARTHAEFAHILREPNARYMLTRLNDVRVLSAVHPQLAFHADKGRAISTLCSWEAPTASFWPLLAWPDNEAAASSISSRLALTRTQRAVVASVPELRRLAPKLSISSLTRTRLVSLFDPFPLAALWTVAAMSDGTIRQRLLELLRDARHVRPLLSGDDLIALGITPGPQVGQILRRIRDAKLNTEVRTRVDEERLVHKLTSLSPE